MLLRTLRKIPKTIGFKLTFWYSIIFIISVSLLFLFAYLYLQTTLIRKDHDETLTRLRELKSFYRSGGFPLLVRGIAASKKSPEKSKFFIRLADRMNHTMYIYLPYQWVGFNIQRLELEPPERGKWIRLPDQHKHIFLEISSAKLRNGYWLQVGQDTRGRRQILTKFRGLTTFIILPLFLLGVLGGSFLAHRALSPIRQLIHTVSAVSQDMEALEKQVPNPHSGDELEELITLFNRMLQKIDTLIKVMRSSLDNVAHDLRTPVTRLRCMAELALQSGEVKGEGQKALEECLEESLVMQKLLNAIMDISEAETGVMHLETHLVSLDKIVREVKELYAFVAEEKDISIDVETQPDLFLRADSTRIGQVMANLVDNAIKFTPKGGRVWIKTYRDRDQAVIVVQDNGIGISAKDIPRIWDRLYRGDQSRSQKGLGLGLSLVKIIIELHKGRVEVRSNPGEGSAFFIYLPLA